MDTTEQNRQSCVITQRRTKHANPLAPGPRNTTTVTTLQARNRRRVDYGPVEPPGLLVAVSVAVFSWDLLSSARFSAVASPVLSPFSVLCFSPFITSRLSAPSACFPSFSTPLIIPSSPSPPLP
ncbi:hypothetical protein CLIM01_00829 [Colletotrichum limetticola]|uniref:Uncharacterized protein n=1 Tax=Colletotrichum limetticola TaxID=1209924 RepID=A0ABQ9QDB0_9PEZI|nr:hypothetical protein CLIM01_00829 [Colletotrichum limetticola]